MLSTSDIAASSIKYRPFRHLTDEWMYFGWYIESRRRAVMRHGIVMSAITRKVVMALRKLLLLTLIKDKDKRLTK